MDKIKKICYKNRIRINEFFIDFDPLRSGYINKNQLRQTFSMLRLNLTENEIQSVIDIYYEKAKDKINHQRLTKDINEIFKMNEKDIKPFLKENANTLAEEKVSLFEDLLKRIKFDCEKKGILVKHCFNDFDPHNNGKISKTQFLRGIPFKLKKEETDLLIEKYEDKDGHINYLQLRDGILEIEKKEKDLNSQKATFVMYLNEGIERKKPVVCDGNEVLKKLTVLVRKNRIDLLEPFQDFDKLKRGKITQNQFESIIGSVKFPNADNFTKEEITALSEKYLTVAKDKVREVHYKQLHKDLWDRSIKI